MKLCILSMFFLAGIMKLFSFVPTNVHKVIVFMVKHNQIKTLPAGNNGQIAVDELHKGLQKRLFIEYSRHL